MVYPPTWVTIGLLTRLHSWVRADFELVRVEAPRWYANVAKMDAIAADPA